MPCTGPYRDHSPLAHHGVPATMLKAPSHLSGLPLHLWVMHVLMLICCVCQQSRQSNVPSHWCGSRWNHRIHLWIRCNQREQGGVALLFPFLPPWEGGSPRTRSGRQGRAGRPAAPCSPPAAPCPPLWWARARVHSTGGAEPGAGPPAAALRRAASPRAERGTRSIWLSVN